jgi:aminopeptidase N
MREENFTCNFYDPRFVLPGTVPQYTPDRAFQPVHIRLEFDVDMKDKIVHGKCTTKLRSFANGPLVFNAVGMKIKSVKADGRRLKYKYDGEKIEIAIDKIKYGEETDVTIDYSLVKPTTGVYFIQPDRKYPKKPQQVWTHSESQDARSWYPCVDAPDAKATTEMLITVPKDFYALSNGSLIEVRTGRSKKTFHWKMTMPHSTYLVMFAVGRFSEVRDRWKNVDVLYYCEKGREADIKRSFGKTPRMIDFFSNKIGVSYPYEKYAQVAVEDFIFGGMEHTTATTQTNTVLCDEIAAAEIIDSPVSLAAHELAHQWFGDLLTCKDWAHAWLNESFATYFEALYMQHEYGEDMFRWEMYRNAQAYFDEDLNRYRRPIVSNLYADPGDIFDRHLYQKGGAVLHMIHAILGDDLWWKSINHYVKNFFNASVETADLITSIRLATGVNMGKFFDQWIFKAGHPEYVVKYSWNERRKEASLRVVQMQKTGDETPLVAMPVNIVFETRGGVKKFRETVDGKQHMFVYKFPAEPTNVWFDPENVILKKLTMNKKRFMFYRDLKNSNVMLRIFAAQAIAATASEDDMKVLEGALSDEKFWGAQIEMALAIGSVRTEAAFGILENALSSVKHNRAKRAIIDALGGFRNEKIIPLMKHYLHVKNSYLVPAEALRAMGRTKNPAATQMILDGLKRDSWSDIIRMHAVVALSALGTEKAVGELKRATEYGHPHRVRMVAARELGVVGKNRGDVVELMINLTHDNFPLLQNAAVDALGDLGDEAALPRLREIVDGRFDSRVKRGAVEAIRKIQPWMDSDLKTSDLNTKIADLQKQLAAKKK